MCAKSQGHSGLHQDTGSFEGHRVAQQPLDVTQSRGRAPAGIPRTSQGPRPGVVPLAGDRLLALPAESLAPSSSRGFIPPHGFKADEPLALCPAIGTGPGFGTAAMPRAPLVWGWGGETGAPSPAGEKAPWCVCGEQILAPRRPQRIKCLSSP